MPSIVASVTRVVALLAPVFFIIFTIRGYARALVADLMGDPTPREEGFVSLNPAAHIDVIKCLSVIAIISLLSAFIPDTNTRQLLVILILIGGAQWVYPVPINERNFKNPRMGVILTTLAGPIGTLFAALLAMYVASIFFKFSLSDQALITVQQILYSIIDLSIYSALFDLLPLPPFEGARLLPFILPRMWLGLVEWLERYGIIVIFVLFVLPGFSDYFFLFLYKANIFIQSALLKAVLI